MRGLRFVPCALVVLGVLGGGGVGRAGVITLQPTDDTYVDTREPNRVFNGDPWERILHADYSWIGPHYRNSLLRFDLAPVPSGATILAASLHMYAVATSDEHTFLYRTEQDDWDEDSTSWSSYEPYMTGAPLIADADVCAPYAGNHWVEWSIDLADWTWTADLADGAVTLLLKGDVSDTNYSIGAQLCSKEYRTVGGEPRIPYLELVWVPEPSAAASLIALVGLAASARRTIRPGA